SSSAVATSREGHRCMPTPEGRPRQVQGLLRPSPAKLRWDAPAVLALARRIRWSICAPHVGQFDVGVTLFLEVPFRQLWCITSLSGKSAPALTGPRQAWATTPAGLGIRSCPGRGPRSKDHLRPNAGALFSHDH